MHEKFFEIVSYNRNKCLARKMAEENGEACDHWVDEEKYRSLEGKEKKKYFRDTFEVLVIAAPLEDGKLGQCEIRCRSNDFYSGLKMCDKKFPKTEKQFTEYMQKSIENYASVCPRKF